MPHRTLGSRSPTAAVLLISVAMGCAAAQARDAVEYSTQELVEALAMQRFQKLLLAGPTRSAPPNDAVIVLLEGKGLQLAPRLTSVPGMRVLTQEQLVAEQRANFLIISQLGSQGRDMLVDYYTPRNASYGVLRIQAADGKLVFKAEDSYRSSSGVRATYARLYGGQPCRDGTEMAYAYNYYANSSESGKCRAAVFPSTNSAADWYR
ncbi:hypothetical protein ACFIQF_19840 [Comamonas sp. J-3]|uniref:hypothetical protein n=1 Tax=Comamonas trifloxystrobinivorans TaxID=3350256 RepID=UPI00372B3930